MMQVSFIPIKIATDISNLNIYVFTCLDGDLECFHFPPELD